MLVIDLRPYEREKPSKPLQTILDEHIRSIRGPAQVIYNEVDKIILTADQFADLSTDYNIPLEII